MATKPGFTYTDLFAGVGGFAAALNALGGTHVLSAEIDDAAAQTYLANFGVNPKGDVRNIAGDDGVLTISTDILAGGFPCQPFSKSGAQRGTLDKVRGTLFENILLFVRENKPQIILLENVRNLIGPKHLSDFNEIIAQLRNAGYRVSDEPSVISPHLLPKTHGGRPQSRPRIYISATYNPSANDLEFWENPVPAVTPKHLVEKFGKIEWNLNEDLPLLQLNQTSKNKISEEELRWLKTWEKFLELFLKSSPDTKLPGFPLWTDAWFKPKSDEFSGEMPRWKKELVEKNKTFYRANKKWIDEWLAENPGFKDFPNSRRKFEWQAGNSTSLWKCAIQLRPSGVRVKKLTYLPALVAVNQSSIIGTQKRRITVRESARLQGFPEGYLFGSGNSSEKQAYKQMGNAVHVGSVFYVLKEHVKRDADILSKTEAGIRILEKVLGAPNSPDQVFDNWGGAVTKQKKLPPK